MLDAVSKVTKPKDASKPGRPYIMLKMDGDIGGSDLLFCYHQSLFEALANAKEKVCQFEWEKRGDWLNIENVLAIGSQEYRDGKPFNPDSEPITDQDVGF